MPLCQVGKPVDTPVLLCYTLTMDSTVVTNRINRTEIAKRTGMDVTVISRFFNRRRTPDLEQAKKIADAMSVSLDELYRILTK